MTAGAGRCPGGYSVGVAGASAVVRQLTALALDQQANLPSPSGLAVVEKPNLYIADTGNNVIRQLAGPDQVLRTRAGTGKAGESGHGRPAILAQLSAPTGGAGRPDADGVRADTGNN